MLSSDELISDLAGDPTIAALVAAFSDPKTGLIEIDRAIVAAYGLRGFVQVAWSVIEREGTYKSNWHIDAICDHLQAVSRGEIKRLGIAVPPRHMKSLTCAVFWPAWDWIENPWRRFLFSSYAQNLSIRDSLKCRRIVESPWYQARWGDTVRLASDQNTKSRFENTAGGYRLSTSVRGQLTGEGGDFVCVDDAINSSKAASAKERENTNNWWSEAMSTRLNDPNTGAFVIIMQRLHEQDLMGYVLQREGIMSKGGIWHYLCLPARYEPDHPFRYAGDPRTQPGQLLWPEHLSEGTLAALEMALGSYAAAGQLQQRPAPREGGMFKREWFKPVNTVAADTTWLRSWDLAATEKSMTKADPDYTAGVLIGFSEARGRWIIAHCDHFRANPGEVYRKMRFRAEADKATLGYHQILYPQDPGQAGKDQVQALGKALTGFSFISGPVTGDKVTRATPMSAQAEMGNIEILYQQGHDAVNDWQSGFLDEMCSFPNGAHDDRTDAAASGFNQLCGGTDGLLKYFQRRLAERAKADEEAKKVESVQMRIITGETDNLARAYLRPRHQ